LFFGRLRSIATGDIIAIIFSVSERRRQKNVKGLAEDQRVLMALHEHAVQRPIEVLARAEPCGIDRQGRLDHRSRSQRQAGLAQAAHEIGDVFGKAPFALAR